MTTPEKANQISNKAIEITILQEVADMLAVQLDVYKKKIERAKVELEDLHADFFSLDTAETPVITPTQELKEG